jgi:hypothetical protein
MRFVNPENPDESERGGRLAQDERLTGNGVEHYS